MRQQQYSTLGISGASVLKNTTGGWHFEERHNVLVANTATRNPPPCIDS